MPPLPYANTISQQDCLTGMAGLPAESADIIIADPPYNIGKDFGNNSDRRSLPDYLAWSKAWLGQCMRLLKKSGTMFVYGFPEILAHLSVFLPIDKQRWLQWHYTNKNMPTLHFWQRSHESILCVWKEKPLFNRDAVREPYTQGFLAGSAGRTRPAGPCRLGKAGGRQTVYQAHAQGALPRDVIHVPSLAGGASLRERNIFCKSCGALIAPTARKHHAGHDLIIHPTQKPRALTQRLLRSCRPDGRFNALVPFCGSGSECACVLQLGGRYVAYELNEDYVRLARAVTGCALTPLFSASSKAGSCG